MTNLLKEAFAKASKLPPQEQDALASILLDELASERRWARAFARSQKQLGRLADEALAEFHEGKTVPLDEEQL
jgi:hypothetical protein